MPSARVFRVASSLGVGLALACSGLATFGPRRGALAAAAPPPAEGATHEPCVSATIRTEDEHLGYDGVLRRTEYRDHYVRCRTRVWIERIVPGEPRRHDTSNDGVHGLPPLYGLARLIEVHEDGSASLALVSRREARVIDVPPDAFDRVGFAGEWSSAAHLLSDDRLAVLAPLPRAAENGARWLSRRDETGTVTVLWSTALTLALRVETRNADGSAKARISVEDLSLRPSELPWENTASFVRRDFDDYGD